MLIWTNFDAIDKSSWPPTWNGGGDSWLLVWDLPSRIYKVRRFTTEDGSPTWWDEYDNDRSTLSDMSLSDDVEGERWWTRLRDPDWARFDHTGLPWTRFDNRGTDGRDSEGPAVP